MSIAMLIILVAAALFFYYFVGMVIMLYYCDESNSDLAVWIEDMTNGDSFAAFSGVVLMWPLLLVRIACVALWWLLRNLGGSKSILGGAGKFLINVVRMK